MDFYKIQNNTNNPIIINGNYIGSYSEVILNNEVLSLIDTVYFDTGILINHGIVEIDNDHVTINTDAVQYYRKPPTGIPKSHLASDVKTILDKANKTLKDKISINDLDTTLQETIKNSKTSNIKHPQSNSLLIKEEQLERKVREKLQSVIDLKEKYDQKVNYDDLSSEVQFILEQINSDSDNFWKEPVAMKELLPLDNNKEGDIRFVLEDDSLWKWDTEDWINIDFTKRNQPDKSDNNINGPKLSDRNVIGEAFAFEGQKIFKSKKPYEVGSNNLQVMLNGLLMMKDTDYTEVDNYTIEFLDGLKEDDYVLLVYSGSSNENVVLVENIIIEESNRYVKLSMPFEKDVNAIKVYLNGIFVSPEIENIKGDYIEHDDSTIKFNFDLDEGDRVIVRYESATLADNLKTKFAAVQKVYFGLAKEIELIKEQLRN